MSRKVRIVTLSMLYQKAQKDLGYYNFMMQNASEYLYEAAKEKPDLVVFPENFAHLNSSINTTIQQSY